MNDDDFDRRLRQIFTDSLTPVDSRPAWRRHMEQRAGARRLHLSRQWPLAFASILLILALAAAIRFWPHEGSILVIGGEEAPTTLATDGQHEVLQLETIPHFEPPEVKALELELVSADRIASPIVLNFASHGPRILSLLQAMEEAELLPAAGGTVAAVGEAATLKLASGDELRLDYFANTEDLVSISYLRAGVGRRGLLEGPRLYRELSELFAEARAREETTGRRYGDLVPLSLENLAMVEVYGSGQALPPVWVLTPALHEEKIDRLLSAYQGVTVTEPAGGGIATVGRRVLFHLKDGTEVGVQLEDPDGLPSGWRYQRGEQDEGEMLEDYVSPGELANVIQEILAEAEVAPLVGVELPPTMPPDFGFLVGEGEGGLTVADTFSGTVTKSPGGWGNRLAGTSSGPFALSPEQTATMYAALVAADFLSYPSVPQPHSGQMQATPHIGYYLMVRAAGREWVVRWDNGDWGDPSFQPLWDAYEILREIVRESPHYQAVPGGQEAYL